MPLKWNIYKTVLIIYMTCNLALLIIILIGQANRKQEAEELVWLLLGIAMMLCIFFNGFLNFLWMQLYYPDQWPSRKMSISTKIFHWLTLPILLLCCFAAIGSINSFVAAELSLAGRNITYIAANLALLVIGLTGLISFIFQLQLFRLIRRNSKKAFEGFME